MISQKVHSQRPHDPQQDEWAQIASTLTSIKSLSKDSVYDQEFEETFWKIMTGETTIMIIIHLH